MCGRHPPISRWGDGRWPDPVQLGRRAPVRQRQAEADEVDADKLALGLEAQRQVPQEDRRGTTVQVMFFRCVCYRLFLDNFPKRDGNGLAKKIRVSNFP